MQYGQLPLGQDLAVDLDAALHRVHGLFGHQRRQFHAAAGGVGQLLVQLVKARGAHVVATVGAADKERVARELGADEVIRYDEVDDLPAAVKAASRGEGQ